MAVVKVSGSPRQRLQTSDFETALVVFVVTTIILWLTQVGHVEVARSRDRTVYSIRTLFVHSFIEIYKNRKVDEST